MGRSDAGIAPAQDPHGMQDAWPTIGLGNAANKRAARRLWQARLARGAHVWRGRNTSVAQAQLSERVRRGAWLANGLSLVLVGGKVKVYTHPPVACAVLRAAIGL